MYVFSVVQSEAQWCRTDFDFKMWVLKYEEKKAFIILL